MVCRLHYQLQSCKRVVELGSGFVHLASIAKLGVVCTAAAAGVLLFLKNKKSRKGAQSNKAVVEKGVPKLAIGDLKAEEEGGKPAQAVMDTAMRLQSTGGADSYQKLGVMHTIGVTTHA